MLASLKAASDLIKIAVGAVLGALVAGLLTWAATFAYVSWITIPAERKEASDARDAVWERRETAAKQQREDERQATQAQIDTIEADYHRRDQARRADMAELERTLQDLATDVPTPTLSPGTPPACRSAVPSGVSQALDRLGRAAPRDDSAKPDAAVPGRR